MIRIEGIGTGNIYSFQGIADVFMNVTSGRRVVYVPEEHRNTVNQLFGNDPIGLIITDIGEGHLSFSRHTRKRAGERLRGHLVPEIRVDCSHTTREMRIQGILGEIPDTLRYPRLNMPVVA